MFLWELLVLAIATDPEVGLRIDRSQILETFSGERLEFFGDCPGSRLSGAASSRDIRFLSGTLPPAKHLRVHLTNVTTGQSLKKDYDRPEKGSNDFALSRLGNTDGSHTIDYQIANKKTDIVLETGRFSYQVAIATTRQERNGTWRVENFCIGGGSVRDCKTFEVRRERKVCPDGNPTSQEIRNEQFIDRRPR